MYSLAPANTLIKQVCCYVMVHRKRELPTQARVDRRIIEITNSISYHSIQELTSCKKALKQALSPLQKRSYEDHLVTRVIHAIDKLIPTSDAEHFSVIPQTESQLLELGGVFL